MKEINKLKQDLVKTIPQLQRLKLEQLATVTGGPMAIIRKEG